MFMYNEANCCVNLYGKSCFKDRRIKMKVRRFSELFYDVIFLNISRFVILLYCCKCVFHLCAVSLKKNGEIPSKRTNIINK